MKSFDERLARADRSVFAMLNDGTATLYDRAGQVLATDLKVTLEKSVEHPSNMIERINIISINRRDIPNYERNGSIAHAGITWKIDDIVSDDGYLLELAVTRHEKRSTTHP